MLDNEKYLDNDAFIDEILKQEPAYQLPDGFASKVAFTVGQRFAWQQYVREFLIYLAAIIGIAVVTAGMAFIWYEANWKNWLDFLVTNGILIAGINLLVVFVLFADRVLLRYFFYLSALKQK